MTAETDLLASVNLYPYDPASNPGGLSAGGYLAEVGGVSLVGRAVRAMGGASDQLLQALRLSQSRSRRRASGIANLCTSPYGEAGETAPDSSDLVEGVGWAGANAWQITNRGGAYPDIANPISGMPAGSQVIAAAWVYHEMDVAVELGFAGFGGMGKQSLQPGAWGLYAQNFTLSGTELRLEARLGGFGGVPDETVFLVDDVFIGLGTQSAVDLCSTVSPLQDGFLDAQWSQDQADAITALVAPASAHLTAAASAASSARAAVPAFDFSLL